MIEAILVVFSKPKDGRDDDFNDWYTNIHIRDALRFRGAIAAQRFALSPDQPQRLSGDFGWKYLALYDVFDAARFSREHWDNALTPRMMVTDSFDDTVLDDYHYYPLMFRNNDPDAAQRGGLIAEQLNAAPGQEAAFQDWYLDSYLPAAMQRLGVQSGALLKFRPYGQLMPTAPAHAYFAFYRIADAACITGWRNDRLLDDSPLVDHASMQITAWDKLTDRVTEDDVRHTSAAALAAEERARARMGDKVMAGGKEKLKQ